MLAAWLKRYYQCVWWTLFLLCGLPAAALIWKFERGLLGINPLETLMGTTGKWALIMLLVTLGMTPLRRSLVKLSRHLHSGYGKRLSDWNWIIRLRRMLGNYSFFYASVHLFIYLHFDLGWDWLSFGDDVREKSYILAGLSAFVLLAPLAATSTDGMMRRLGRGWRRLHRLVYLILVIVLLHFWWQVKTGVYTPWPYTALAALLLGYRLVTYYGWVTPKSVDDGMEVPERERGLDVHNMHDFR
jgi:sulfoxide reductase heme-binding subunit YedZ